MTGRSVGLTPHGHRPHNVGRSSRLPGGSNAASFHPHMGRADSGVNEEGYAFPSANHSLGTLTRVSQLSNPVEHRGVASVPHLSRQHLTDWGAVQSRTKTSRGVMQFVAADEIPLEKSHRSVERKHLDTSWEAVEDHQLSINEKLIRGKSVGSPTSAIRSKSVSFAESSSVSASNNMAGKGPRIARLASLFSSSAGVGTETTDRTFSKRSDTSKKVHFRAQDISKEPPSPSQSSSSAGYVGWPGTQDKSGATVALQSSSFETTDVGDLALSNAYNADMVNRDNFVATSVQQNNMNSNQRISPPKAAHILSSQLTQTETPLFSPRQQHPSKNSNSQSTHDLVKTQSKDIQTSRVHSLYRQGTSYPWGQTPAISSPSRSNVSLPSSAYFDHDAKAITSSGTDDFNYNASTGKAKMQVASVMRGLQPQPPTERALAENDRMSPPRRTFNATHIRGYRGFIEKAQDVPNLMDEDSESFSSSVRSSSSITPSASLGPTCNNHSRNPMPRVSEEGPCVRRHADDESDVFDEISKYSMGEKSFPSYPQEKGARTEDTRVKTPPNAQPLDLTSATDAQKRKLKVVLLGGGLTTIQTPPLAFTNRKTASDFDENLSNSDCDQYGYVRIPGFSEMATAGRRGDDAASAVEMSVVGIGEDSDDYCPSKLETTALTVDTTMSMDRDYQDDESAFYSDFYAWSEGYSGGDLSQYYIPPSQVKKLVTKYRKMSKLESARAQTYDEIDRAEDEKKAFALFEMRSRIMEKDMERGLERRGGTKHVDDIVTTKYFQTGQRIRDAVIVSKAWRDGASPVDVVNTALLTRRAERSYFLRRPLNRYIDIDHPMQRYQWEQVTWMDDTDFMLHKCPSLGPSNLKGFQIFTIGDCQSILLKLTNERCQELRAELNAATARQIEAEELMKDDFDSRVDMMSEAELCYLSSMVEVKTISRKLVIAENAFSLVRERIEKLVERYKVLLEKIQKLDAGSCVSSSVLTYESSYYSDDCSSVEDQSKMLARRAKRAEIEAALNARETLLEHEMERGTGNAIDPFKMKELEDLEQELIELKSDTTLNSSQATRQHSVVLARAITAQQKAANGQSARLVAGNKREMKVADVKQRFRDRMATRNRDSKIESSSVSPRAMEPNFQKKDRAVNGDRHLFQAAGEEMYQHLDFYERSLQAVERSRNEF